MDVLESIIFGFVTVFGSLLLLVLVFNCCLQPIFAGLKSRNIFKKLTAKLRLAWANWRPVKRSTLDAVNRLQNLLFLRFKGRAMNEQEQFGRAVFQFEVIDTPWLVLVRDGTLGRSTLPITLFFDASKSTSKQWPYASYESFLQQIPHTLRKQFKQHKELFSHETPISRTSPLRAKLKHWRRRITGWLFGAYAVIAGLYLVYGLIFKKGVVGRLIYYFGEDQGGGDSVTGGGGIAIVLYMFSLLSYGFLDIFFNSGKSESTEPSAAQEPYVYEPPTAEPVRPISWKTIFFTNVTILLLTGLACLPLVAMRLSDQRQPIVSLDLARDESPSEAAKFAAIRGVLQSEHEFHWVKENGSTNEVWTPLVGSKWRPEQPVKYIYLRRWESVATSNEPISVWRGPQDPVLRSKWLKRQGQSDTAPAPTYTVQLSKNSLPTWVEMKLQEQGIKLASPYYLAETVRLDSEGKVDADPISIFVFGMVIAGLVGFVITFFLFMDRVVHRTNVRESLPVSVTAVHLARGAEIHLPIPDGTALHFKFPRHAKSGDIFRLSKSESDPEGESIYIRLNITN